ncbi:MAG: alpha/beta fold hydrolase [Chloroflexota bacterium]
MVWDYQHLISRRLLYWSAISMIAGISLSLSGGDFWRGFGIQALAWGLVDAIIAGFGLRGSLPKLFMPFELETAIREAHKLRRILWVNTWLDVVYISAGVALYLTRGQTDDFFAGTGIGIILQGGFLLVFDWWHYRNTPYESLLPDLGIFNEKEHDTTTLPGKRGAVLIVHGFPGSPAEMLALAKAINQQGWHVRLARLPGHGKEFRRLLQVRAIEWQASIRREVDDLKAAYSPLVLLGYSLGGGIFLSMAKDLSADRLILVSPFWMPQKWWLNGALFFLRPLLPVAFRPFRTPWLKPEHFQASSTEILPGFDLHDPEVREKLMQIRLPVIFLEQFQWLSRRIWNNVSKIKIPVLVVQGNQDPVVRKETTRLLVKQIIAPCDYIEIEGDHNINLPSNPGYPALEAAVLQYLKH